MTSKYSFTVPRPQGGAMIMAEDAGSIIDTLNSNYQGLNAIPTTNVELAPNAFMYQTQKPIGTNIIDEYKEGGYTDFGLPTGSIVGKLTKAGRPRKPRKPRAV